MRRLFFGWVLVLTLAGCGDESKPPESRSVQEETGPVDNAGDKATLGPAAKNTVEPEIEVEAEDEPEINPYLELEYALGEMLEVYQAAEAIGGDRAKAVGELWSERAGLQSAVQLFSRGPSPEKDLANPKRNLENFREAAAEYEASGDLEKASEYRWKAKNQALAIQVMRLQGPDQRADLKAELEERLRVVKEKYSKKSAPANERLAVLKKKNKRLEKTIESGMSQFFRTPADLDVELTIGPTRYTVTHDWLSIKWKLPNGKQAFSARAFLRSDPGNGATSDLYLGKYPYTKWNDWLLRLRAGYFEVQLNVHHEDYKTKERVGEMLELLVDLAALSTLTPRFESN